MNRHDRRTQAKQARSLIVTSEPRAHFIRQELAGIANAFGVGDLRAMVICQYWHDGECMNTWHIESDEQRVAIIARLKEMIAHLEQPFAPEG